MDSLQLSILVPLLFLTSYCDFCWHIIPNFITLPLAALGIVVNVLIMGIHGLWISVLGCVIGLGCFLLIYLMKAMGAGDVKLMAGIGAVVGVSKIMSVMLLTFFIGGLLAILAIGITMGRSFFFSTSRSGKKKSGLKTGLKKSIPYGVAISAGTLASFFF